MLELGQATHGNRTHGRRSSPRATAQTSTFSLRLYVSFFVLSHALSPLLFVFR